MLLYNTWCFNFPWKRKVPTSFCILFVLLFRALSSIALDITIGGKNFLFTVPPTAPFKHDVNVGASLCSSWYSVNKLTSLGWVPLKLDFLINWFVSVLINFDSSDTKMALKPFSDNRLLAATLNLFVESCFTASLMLPARYKDLSLPSFFMWT